MSEPDLRIGDNQGGVGGILREISTWYDEKGDV
jgi:hypothetical protein